MLTLQKTGQHSDFPENLKTLLTDPLTKGRTEFEEMLSHQEKNIFRNPSSTKWSLYVYGAVFLVCIISSKNAQTKFHA